MDTFEESASRILDGMAEAGRRQQRPAQFAIGKVLEDFARDYGREMADILWSYRAVNFNVCD